MIPGVLFAAVGAGGGGFAVNIASASVVHNVTTPSAKAGIKLGTDGTLYLVQGVTETPVSNQWLDPNDATEADNYEVIVVTTFGSLSSGTTGSYLALTSDREWFIQRASFGSSFCTINVKINRIGNRALVLGNASFDLEAMVEA